MLFDTCRYFLPRSVTKLDRLSSPTYALQRPPSGWRFWFPDKNMPRRRTNTLAPRALRREWSPASSQQDSSFAHSTGTDDGPSSQPLAHDASAFGANRSQPNDVHNVNKPVMHSPSPAASPAAVEHSPPSATPVTLSDPASISLAIQSLSRIIPPMTVVADPPSVSPAPVSCAFVQRE